MPSVARNMTTQLTLIESEYACLWHYPEEGIVHHRLLQPVSSDTFRNVLMTGLGLMTEHGARKWLSDDRGNSILSADDSAWSQEYWLPRALGAGWKCWAVLPPTRARGQLNMARLMEFVGEMSGVRIEIFSDPDEAWRWLADQG